ncbi:MAG: N-acetylneuraminate synthase family protein [candidate division NC10 bacterium]
MSRTIEIAGRKVGNGEPAFIIAEIGINHNGDLEVAKKLVDAAKVAGCDAVKFQKRTPELCVPSDQKDLLRETPWGLITYLDYRYRVEFGKDEYHEIDQYCRERGIIWFASVWDEGSVDFLDAFDPPCLKIPSAALTDHQLLRHARATGRPVILSTGMSTMEQIRAAVDTLGTKDLLITHCTSAYPSTPDELNLRVIASLQKKFDCPIGYSGHEVGLQTTYAAVLQGACLVERHITLDRAMWGSDQAASVEPSGFMRLVRDIRTIERALGDGVKKVYESELPIMKKLRRVDNT